MRRESALLREWTWSPTYHLAYVKTVWGPLFCYFHLAQLFYGSGDKAMYGVGIKGHIASSNKQLKEQYFRPPQFPQLSLLCFGHSKRVVMDALFTFSSSWKKFYFQSLQFILHFWYWAEVIQTLLQRGIAMRCKCIFQWIALEAMRHFGLAKNSYPPQKALLHFLFFVFLNVKLVGYCFLYSSIVAFSFDLSCHCLLCAKVLYWHLATCPLGESCGRGIGP